MLSADDPHAVGPDGVGADQDGGVPRARGLARSRRPGDGRRVRAAALMTVRYPEELGVHTNLAVVPETFPTLATRLAAMAGGRPPW